MSRSRNIKPGFFRNEVLVDLPFEYRLLFIGLWTMADREGRMEDRPVKIKMELFPADSVDVDLGLKALWSNGFISRYMVGDSKFIQILAWSKHQNPHVKEAPSCIPAQDLHECCTMLAEEIPEPAGLIPDSLNLIPDSKVKATVRATPAPDDQFDAFWDAYPVKKGKEAARKAWVKLKLSVVQQDAIIVKVLQQKMSDYDWGRGFCPHPATYLNGKRWNDEIGRPKPVEVAAPSKTLQAMQLLQDKKNGLDRTGSDDRLSGAGFFEPGSATGFGRIANDG